MFPPFPTEEAHEICCQMIEQLQNGIISMEQITPISQERCDSGVMLGVLVCKNSFLHSLSVHQQINFLFGFFISLGNI